MSFSRSYCCHKVQKISFPLRPICINPSAQLLCRKEGYTKPQTQSTYCTCSISMPLCINNNGQPYLPWRVLRCPRAAASFYSVPAKNRRVRAAAFGRQNQTDVPRCSYLAACLRIIDWSGSMAVSVRPRCANYTVGGMIYGTVLRATLLYCIGMADCSVAAPASPFHALTPPSSSPPQKGQVNGM